MINQGPDKYFERHRKDNNFLNPDEFPHTQNEDTLFIDDATPLQVNQIHQSLNPKLFPQQYSSLKKSLTHSECGSQIMPYNDSRKKSGLAESLDNGFKNNLKSKSKTKTLQAKIYWSLFYYNRL